MTHAADSDAEYIPHPRASGVPLSWLVSVLLALFAADNLLLFQFLGLPPLLTLLLVALACPLVAILTGKAITKDHVVPWRAIAVAGALSLAVFALGGQGRLFYANPDWQIRDAILSDMARYAWPFAYPIEGEAAILRAPIGLYLLPALAGAWSEAALLLSNALRLTLLLAICWPLFERSRDRWIALSVFFAISGLDLVGTALFDNLGVSVSWDHMERWNFNNQYSAHVTQAFWVPQHALAGWACAAAFLLWQKGLARIGLFAAIIPLVAIWSPLAIMGAIPFALLAGVTVLRSGDWSVKDIAFAACAVALALPSLAYLQADAAQLGSGARLIALLPYLFLVGLEVLPFVLPPLLSSANAKQKRLTLWIILACLLAMPLYQIGSNSDFQMRASIMPLALLAIYFAKWLVQLVDRWPSARVGMGYAVALLAVGAATPVMEIRRAFLFPPSPKPLCSLLGVWHKQKGLIVAPYATYFARTKALPTWLGPIPLLAGKSDPAVCWDRNWPSPGDSPEKSV